MSEKKILQEWSNMRRTVKKAGLNTTLVSKKEENAQRQKLFAMSRLTYCNPGCKGTIYSDDPQWVTHLKKEYQKKVDNKEMKSKNAKNLLTFLHVHRKTLVKESGSTLLDKNSFYRKIRPAGLFPFTSKKKEFSPSNYKKTMKSRGALSLCKQFF